MHRRINPGINYRRWTFGVFWYTSVKDTPLSDVTFLQDINYNQDGMRQIRNVTIITSQRDVILYPNHILLYAEKILAY